MTKNNSKHVKPKERAIRYYGYDKIAYKLYEEGKNNQQFHNLINLLQDDNNIAQAYRSIKANKGAKTKGSDRKNITNIANIKLEILRKMILKDCKNYHPSSIRRVMIPKKKPGEFRPLGIPTTYDKLIQQTIKQIIEPIFEAKFVSTSYGFRPARNQHQAIEHIQKLIAQGEYTHAIEFDIKKCFDNVSHEILMEILYREGIRDEKVLMMIKAMLKAEIVGEGIPDKGTPQGGILSPLLANIYLNELDKFIYEKYQWLPKSKYNLKTSKAKPVHIVRYADDFCIFTKSRKDALHYMDLTIKFLKEQLKLDYSPEKTRITNLKRRAITFLGIKIKACKSKDKKIKHLVAKSSIPKESVDKLIKKVSIETNPKLRISIIRGVFNYWRIATNVTEAVSRYNYLRRKATKIKPTKNRTPRETDRNKGLSISSEGLISRCKYIKTLTACQDSFIKNIEKLTDLDISTWFKRDYDTIEKYDIIRSKYRAQKYKDTITKEPLLRPHCHRIKPGYKNGKYNYQNCILINDWTHRIIHGTQENLIKFCKTYKLKKKQIERLAKLYKEAH